MTPIHLSPAIIAALVAALFIGLSASFAQDAPRSVSPDSTFHEAIADLEARHAGGRLGVAVLNTETGEHLTHRARERFAMMSTFKWLLAAAVLHRVNEGDLTLADPVTYEPDDLLSYAPVTRDHLTNDDGNLRDEAALSVGALCAAAITLSDNTAANLLLELVGGPDGLTRFARSLGDTKTRLDRTEPTLNENLAGDERMWGRSR